MKNWGAKLKMVFAGIMASIMLFFAASFSVFAANSVTYAGNGTVTLIGTGNQTKEINAQRQALVNCGLNATVGSGSITLESDSAWGTTSPSAIEKYHNQLIKEGILSFIVYDNSVCSLKVNSKADSTRNLVVCLDFSEYNITRFESGFLEGIIYPLMGSISILGIVGNNSMTESTVATDTKPATVQYIDAAHGTLITDKRIDLFLKGVSDNESNTSYMTISGENQAETVYVHDYSLHIILPSNTWWGGTSKITFDANSLSVNGIWGISVSAPSCIGLDISKITLGSQDYISVNQNAAPDTTHFHYIGMQNQMEYCMKKAFDNVLSTSNNKSNYVEEIFVKPFTDSHFTRGYAGVGKENGKLYASVYDQPATETAMPITRTAGILVLYYWLWFEYGGGTNTSFGNANYITYKHYPRDTQTNLVQTDLVATLTFNGQADAQGWYYVYCTHNQNATLVTNKARLIGSFRKVNGEGQFRDSTGTLLA